MTTILERPATPDRLFLWIMHRFAEVFEDHAILKGGMALRLLDSPRSTTAIDYVFVPYTSKKEVREQIERVLGELENVEVSIHSKMLRAEIRIDEAAIQLEVNVAPQCAAIPMATGGFARTQGQPSRVVRIMSLGCALAHKLAAWNERRLLRDLYDCYFLSSRLGENPDLEVLDTRLGSVSSRLPRLRKVQRMSRADLALELREAAGNLTQESLNEELAGILPAEELAGLAPRVKAAITKIAERFDHGTDATGE
jgi:predicted nucleotidyltransferase component of viral defense system